MIIAQLNTHPRRHMTQIQITMDLLLKKVSKLGDLRDNRIIIQNGEVQRPEIIEKSQKVLDSFIFKKLF